MNSHDKVRLENLILLKGNGNLIYFDVPSRNEMNFYKKLTLEVRQELLNSSRLMEIIYVWGRALFFSFGYFYCWHELCFHASNHSLIFLYILALGWCGTGVALNVGHAASHGSFSKYLWVNQSLYWIAMSSLGISAFLWKLGHLKTHHRFVNVAGNDVGINANHQLRISNLTHSSQRYRYQYIYAPLMYCFYSLSLIFLKDYRVFLKGEMDGEKFERTRFRFGELVVSKLIYLFLMLYLPYRYSGYSFIQILLAWGLMNMVLSIYIAACLFTSHINDEVKIIDVAKDGVLPTSYLKQQLDATYDFNPYNWILNFMLDGFNSHAIHHLFPQVSSYHYPKLTHSLQKYALEHSLPYHSGGFFKAIRLHFKYLKRMGQ